MTGTAKKDKKDKKAQEARDREMRAKARINSDAELRALGGQIERPKGDATDAPH
jgi:hypothetical protein